MDDKFDKLNERTSHLDNEPIVRVVLGMDGCSARTIQNQEKTKATGWESNPYTTFSTTSAIKSRSGFLSVKIRRQFCSYNVWTAMGQVNKLIG